MDRDFIMVDEEGSASISRHSYHQRHDPSEVIAIVYCIVIEAESHYFLLEVQLQYQNA